MLRPRSCRLRLQPPVGSEGYGKSAGKGSGKPRCSAAAANFSAIIDSEEGMMRNFQAKRLTTTMLLCGAAMAAPLWAAPALAQAAAEEANANDIIVTAQRRSEKLEEVPMTVQVVSQATLTNAGINTVRELANVTTGFQVGNSGSYPQPAIRGITTINAGAHENNVAL